MDIDIAQQVTELVRPSLSQLGVELREVAWHSPGGGPRSPGILRVVIDRPGGVSLDDCERTSTAVSAVLDAYDPIAARYSLEVSSPGAERTLTGSQEWLDAVGRRVNVRFTAGQSEVVVEGRLLAVATDAIEVEAREGRNRRRVAVIPTADLVAGRIVVDI